MMRGVIMIGEIMYTISHTPAPPPPSSPHTDQTICRLFGKGGKDEGVHGVIGK